MVFRASLNIDDPGTWPLQIQNKLLTQLVMQGPIRNKMTTYPTNASNRRFSNTLYFGSKPYGEPMNRRWLLYSEKNDAIFCFACKLFGSLQMLLTTGYSDWKHVSARLTEDEGSKNHKENMMKWLELELRLRKDKCIDEAMQKQLKAEVSYIEFSLYFYAILFIVNALLLPVPT